jgi:hypothetical protein
MTPTPSRRRSDCRTAESLRGILRELFDLSLAQAQALDREDYPRLETLLTRKADLFPLLQAAMSAAEKRGWSLSDPSTYPAEDGCASVLHEAAGLGRRLQAHEKYVLGQMLWRRNEVGERLNVLTLKRQALAGYRSLTRRGASIDTAR